MMESNKIEADLESNKKGPKLRFETESSVLNFLF